MTSDDLPSYIPADLRAFVVQILAANPATMETAATAHVRAGEHQRRGEMVVAAVWFGAVCVLCERLVGERHPDALTSRNNLAESLGAGGRVGEAIEMLEQLVEDNIRFRRPGHPETLISRGNLAANLCEAGEVQRAIGMQKQLVADFTHELGPDDQRTFTSRHYLATSLRIAGRLGEAIEMHKGLLADRKRRLGGKHVDTLKSRSSLATSLGSAGRVAEAIDMLESLVTDSTLLRGPDDGVTLTARDDLAGLLCGAGRVAEAIAMLERLVRDRTRMQRADHQYTLISRNNLAECLRAAGRFADAIELHQAVLRDRTRVLTVRHPETLTSRNNLALSLAGAGRTGEAIAIQERLVEDCARFLDPDHPLSLTVRNNLAESLGAAGRISDAIGLHERLVMDFARILGPRHPQTLVSRSNLAASLGAGGRIADAIGLLEGLLEEAQLGLGPHHPRTLTIRGNLAVSLLLSGESERAELELAAALAAAERLRETGGDALGRAMTAQLAELDRFAFALASTRVSLGREAESVVDAVETGTARSVLDLLHMRGLDRRAAAQALVDRGAWSDDRRDDYLADLDRLADLEAQDKVAIARGLPADDPHRAPLLREAEAVRTRLAEAERTMLPAARPRPVAEMRRALRAGEALLLYGWSGFGVTLAVVPAEDAGEVRAFRLDRVEPIVGEAPQETVHRSRALIGRVEAVATLVSIGLSSELGRAEVAKQALRTVSDDGALAALLGTTVVDDCGKRIAALERAERVHRERKVRVAVPSLPASTLDALARTLIDFALPAEVRTALEGVSRLVVAPSGPLHELPFDAMLRMARIDGLAEMPVTVVPSGSILAMLRERDARSEFDGPTIVGDPDFGRAADEGPDRDASSWLLASLPRDASETLRRLPFAKVEGEVLADYHNRCARPDAEPVRPLLESEATLAAVYERSRGRRELAIAAHAVLGRIGDPFASAVVLASERGSDGSIRPGLLGLDRLITHWGGRLEGCELAVLSCCSTGRGVRLGDSLMGLPIGFFHAGVRCVVASLWAVDDVATCLLMLRFHQNRLGLHFDLDGHAETDGREAWGRRYGSGERMPVGAALDEAKRWLRKARTRELRGFLGRHEPAAAPPADPKELPPPTRAQVLEARERETCRPPFSDAEYWAAFVVIGDG